MGKLGRGRSSQVCHHQYNVSYQSNGVTSFVAQASLETHTWIRSNPVPVWSGSEAVAHIANHFVALCMVNPNSMLTRPGIQCQIWLLLANGDCHWSLLMISGYVMLPIAYTRPIASSLYLPYSRIYTARICVAEIDEYCGWHAVCIIRETQFQEKQSTILR